MANENAIVGVIIGIEPDDELAGEAMLRRSAEGITIRFEGEQDATLPPGDNAAGMLEVLREVRRMGAAAYVEVDPESRAIERLRIPLESRVVRISEAAGAVEVMLEASHAMHLLARDHADFDEMLATLRAAKEGGAWVLVTETDEHEIVDVRPSPGRPRARRAAEPEPRGGFLEQLFQRLRQWLKGLLRLGGVSEDQARQMFALLSATSCNPLVVPPPCIPFLYPDDGCWARAHEMCRLMLGAGVQPRKVWIDGRLEAPTGNHPSCKVRWGWHVAPTLRVRRGFLRVLDVVLDPSLFAAPVSKQEWKAFQGDPRARLTATAASVYLRDFLPDDPTYSDTNYRLDYFRLQLKARSLQLGPPPYGKCG